MQDTSKMTPDELRNYRIQLFRDAQNFRKPDRMPINANMFNWMFFDAGYSANKAYRDYNLIDDALVKFVTKYKVDAINQLHTGFRNIFQICDSLGGSTVYTSEEDTNMNAVSEELFKAEEYDEIIEDLQKATWTKAIPRLYPKVKEMSLQEFAEASKSLKAYLDARAYSEGKLMHEYGIVVDGVKSCSSGPDKLFNFWRGIKGFSMDLRRHKDKIQAFADKYDPAVTEAAIANMAAAGEGPDMTKPYDVVLVLLSNAVMNRKQFDQYHVPMFTKVLDYCRDHGKHAFVYAEGSWERFGDFFNSYPRGTLSIMVEQDDPYVLREKYPNIALYGGLDVSLMGREGAKEECIAMAKRAIDELGRDGGLVLMPNKMVSYPYDMNGENLKAVCDFIQEYEL